MKSSEWDAFGRPVKKGSRGIPVPDGKGKRLKYYYDILDIKETDKSKPVPLWRVRPEHQEEMPLSRCGVDPAPHLLDEDFRGLLDFNRPSNLL